MDCLIGARSIGAGVGVISFGMLITFGVGESFGIISVCNKVRGSRSWPPVSKLGVQVEVTEIFFLEKGKIVS